MQKARSIRNLDPLSRPPSPSPSPSLRLLVRTRHRPTASASGVLSPDVATAKTWPPRAPPRRSSERLLRSGRRGRIWGPPSPPPPQFISCRCRRMTTTRLTMMVMTALHFPRVIMAPGSERSVEEKCMLHAWDGWRRCGWTKAGMEGAGGGKEVESAFGIHNLRPTSCDGRRARRSWARLVRETGEGAVLKVG